MRTPILYNLQVVPGFLALSFVGWIIFVAGFAREILRSKPLSIRVVIMQCRSLSSGIATDIKLYDPYD